jgi:3-hydroxyisobutyrate dehydrogenase-like beta-hydroxyacid dehydrogenase
MQMKVGLIGLGRMGRAIAARFLGAGNDLVVYNRSPGRAEDLAAAGARVAPDIAGASAEREIVVSMVSDDAALEQVAFAAGGVRDSLPRGAIHMAMGTHSADAIRRAAKRHAAVGQALVSAPVVGRPDAAAAGQLGVIVAGARQDVERCRPLFDAIARRVTSAGPEPEHAAIVKLANNLVIGLAIEAMGEAFSLVRKFGVDAEALYDVLTEGLFASPVYKGYGRLIVDQAYDKAGFTTELGLKDMRLVLAAGGDAKIPLPAVNVFHDHLLSAIAHGHGARDWAVAAKEQAQSAGLE